LGGIGSLAGLAALASAEQQATMVSVATDHGCAVDMTQRVVCTRSCVR
jgi:hypothetical protein